MKVKLDNGSLTPVQSELENTIYDGQGKQVKTHRQSFLLTPQGTQAYSSTFKLNNPHLWQGREDPYLYKVVSRLWQDGKVNDIDKAQARTLYKLSRVLGCSIEDLLENPEL